MAYKPLLKRPPKKKLNRDEKAEITYQRLLKAATQIVGEKGYAATSVAKVVETAGVAQGTFYNYFTDRQQLIDSILPAVGYQLTDSITEEVSEIEDIVEREIGRFRAYCTFLAKNPGFYRILYEAEVFAPKAHAEHIRRISEGYARSLQRSIESSGYHPFKPEELNAIVVMLMGARSYIAMRYIKDGEVPEDAISAYSRMVTNGLFAPLK